MAVKALVEAGKVRSTKAAREGGAALGFDFDGMLAVVMGLAAADFYKSMTTHADHRVWQDVYHVPSEQGALYVKFTADAVTEFLLLSFKEKGDD